MLKQISLLLAGLLIICICIGCSKSSTDTSKTNVNNQAIESGKNEHHHEHKGEHKSAHGGVLNALVTCENGHAEVKIDNDKMCLWFVGGGTDTIKSVRIPDKSITLNVKIADKSKTLVLQPKPLDLAGEKVGDCSYFEGSMPELADAKEFTADGEVTFKNQKTPVKIEYPKGYDPD